MSKLKYVKYIFVFLEYGMWPCVGVCFASTCGATLHECFVLNMCSDFLSSSYSMITFCLYATQGVVPQRQVGVVKGVKLQKKNVTKQEGLCKCKQQ